MPRRPRAALPPPQRPQISQADLLRQLAEALDATHRALRRVAVLDGDVTRGDVRTLLRIDGLLRAVRARLGPGLP